MTSGSARVRDVLRGAYDLHVHGYPEGRLDADHVADDIDAAVMAAQMGMSGYVLKSHFWPTMGRAYHIRRSVPGLNVVAGITLNSLVGGISPPVVEMAILQGAGAIWLPTWSAAGDMARGGLSARLPRIFPRGPEVSPEGGLRAVVDGQVTPAATEVLKMASEAGVTVGTGHLSAAEGVALAKEADRIGFRRLVFTHPWSNSVGATADQVRAAAGFGAWIEMTFVGMLPARHYVGLRNVEEIVDLVGAERCVLTTDGGFDSWSSPAPMLMSLYVSNLLQFGMDARTVRVMIVDNPRRVLGIQEGHSAPPDGADPVAGAAQTVRD